MEIEKHAARFEAYAKDRLNEAGGDDFPMRLKIEHSKKVLENARHIVESEMPAESLGRAALLAALYHDFGRFRQYLRFKTFKDAQSCNHAFLGVRELRREKILNAERDADVHLILAAIALHNRHALPENLPLSLEFTANVVRDSDKLDILRIMDEHLRKPGCPNDTVVLSLPDDASIYSPKTINDVLGHRVPSYTDLRSVNDFRLLLGSWVYAMHFAASRRRFAAAGHARNLLEQLPNDTNYGAPKMKLLALLEEEA